MILLNIYVATILFALFGLIMLSIETTLYAKEHNLVSTKNQTVGRRIFNVVKLIVQCCLPLWNIVVGVIFLCGVFSKNVLEMSVQKCLDEGTIEYKDEEGS